MGQKRAGVHPKKELEATKRHFPLTNFKHERDFHFNIENHPNIKPFVTNGKLPYIFPQLVKCLM